MKKENNNIWNKAFSVFVIYLFLASLITPEVLAQSNQNEDFSKRSPLGESDYINPSAYPSIFGNNLFDSAFVPVNRIKDIPDDKVDPSKVKDKKELKASQLKYGDNLKKSGDLSSLNPAELSKALVEKHSLPSSLAITVVPGVTYDNGKLFNPKFKPKGLDLDSVKNKESIRAISAVSTKLPTSNIDESGFVIFYGDKMPSIVTSEIEGVIEGFEFDDEGNVIVHGSKGDFTLKVGELNGIKDSSGNSIYLAKDGTAVEYKGMKFVAQGSKGTKFNFDDKEGKIGVIGPATFSGTLLNHKIDGKNFNDEMSIKFNSNSKDFFISAKNAQITVDADRYSGSFSANYNDNNLIDFNLNSRGASAAIRGHSTITNDNDVSKRFVTQYSKDGKTIEQIWHNSAVVTTFNEEKAKAGKLTDNEVPNYVKKTIDEKKTEIDKLKTDLQNAKTDAEKKQISTKINELENYRNRISSVKTQSELLGIINEAITRLSADNQRIWSENKNTGFIDYNANDKSLYPGEAKSVDVVPKRMVILPGESSYGIKDDAVSFSGLKDGVYSIYSPAEISEQSGINKIEKRGIIYFQPGIADAQGDFGIARARTSLGLIEVKSGIDVNGDTYSKISKSSVQSNNIADTGLIIVGPSSKNPTTSMIILDADGIHAVDQLITNSKTNQNSEAITNPSLIKAITDNYKKVREIALGVLSAVGQLTDEAKTKIKETFVESFDSIQEYVKQTVQDVNPKVLERIIEINTLKANKDIDGLQKIIQNNQLDATLSGYAKQQLLAVYDSKGDSETADTTLKKWIEESPQDDALKKIQSQREELKKVDNALSRLTGEETPEQLEQIANLNPRLKGEAYSKLSDIYGKNGDYVNAQKYAELARKEFTLGLERAEFDLQKAGYSNIFDFTQKATEVNQRLAEASYNNKDYKLSEDASRFNLAVDKTNLVAQKTLSVSLEQQGSKSDGIKSWKDFIKDNPNNLEAKDNLVQSLYRDGQLKEAVKTIKENPEYANQYSSPTKDILLSLDKRNQVEATEKHLQAASAVKQKLDDVNERIEQLSSGKLTAQEQKEKANLEKQKASLEKQYGLSQSQVVINELIDKVSSGQATPDEVKSYNDALNYRNTVKTNDYLEKINSLMKDSDKNPGNLEQIKQEIAKAKQEGLGDLGQTKLSGGITLNEVVAQIQNENSKNKAAQDVLTTLQKQGPEAAQKVLEQNKANGVDVSKVPLKDGTTLENAIQQVQSAAKESQSKQPQNPYSGKSLEELEAKQKEIEKQKEDIKNAGIFIGAKRTLLETFGVSTAEKKKEDELNKQEALVRNAQYQQALSDLRTGHLSVDGVKNRQDVKFLQLDKDNPYYDALLTYQNEQKLVDAYGTNAGRQFAAFTATENNIVKVDKRINEIGNLLDNGGLSSKETSQLKAEKTRLIERKTELNSIRTQQLNSFQFTGEDGALKDKIQKTLAQEKGYQGIQAAQTKLQEADNIIANMPALYRATGAISDLVGQGFENRKQPIKDAIVEAREQYVANLQNPANAKIYNVEAKEGVNDFESGTIVFFSSISDAGTLASIAIPGAVAGVAGRGTITLLSKIPALSSLGKVGGVVQLEKEFQVLSAAQKAAETAKVATNSERIAVQLASVENKIASVGEASRTARIAAPTLQFATEATIFPVASNVYSETTGALSDLAKGNKVDFSVSNLIPTDAKSYEHSLLMLGAPRVFSSTLRGVTERALGSVATQTQIYRTVDWVGTGLTFGASGATAEGRAVTVQDITQGFALHTGLTAGRSVGDSIVKYANDFKAGITYSDSRSEKTNTNFENDLRKVSSQIAGIAPAIDAAELLQTKKIPSGVPRETAAKLQDLISQADTIKNQQREYNAERQVYQASKAIESFNADVNKKSLSDDELRQQTFARAQLEGNVLEAQKNLIEVRRDTGKISKADAADNLLLVAMQRSNMQEAVNSFREPENAKVVSDYASAVANARAETSSEARDRLEQLRPQAEKAIKEIFDSRDKSLAIQQEIVENEVGLGRRSGNDIQLGLSSLEVQRQQNEIGRQNLKSRLDLDEANSVEQIVERQKNSIEQQKRLLQGMQDYYDAYFVAAKEVDAKGAEARAQQYNEYFRLNRELLAQKSQLIGSESQEQIADTISKLQTQIDNLVANQQLFRAEEGIGKSSSGIKQGIAKQQSDALQNGLGDVASQDFKRVIGSEGRVDRNQVAQVVEQVTKSSKLASDSSAVASLQDRITQFPSQVRDLESTVNQAFEKVVREKFEGKVNPNTDKAYTKQEIAAEIEAERRIGRQDQVQSLLTAVVRDNSLIQAPAGSGKDFYFTPIEQMYRVFVEDEVSANVQLSGELKRKNIDDNSAAYKQAVKIKELQSGKSEAEASRIAEESVYVLDMGTGGEAKTFTQNDLARLRNAKFVFADANDINSLLNQMMYEGYGTRQSSDEIISNMLAARNAIKFLMESSNLINEVHKLSQIPQLIRTIQTEKLSDTQSGALKNIYDILVAQGVVSEANGDFFRAGLGRILRTKSEIADGLKDKEAIKDLEGKSEFEVKVFRPEFLQKVLEGVDAKTRRDFIRNTGREPSVEDLINGKGVLKEYTEILNSLKSTLSMDEKDYVIKDGVPRPSQEKSLAPEELQFGGKYTESLLRLLVSGKDNSKLDGVKVTTESAQSVFSTYNRLMAIADTTTTSLTATPYIVEDALRASTGDNKFEQRTGLTRLFDKGSLNNAFDDANQQSRRIDAKSREGLDYDATTDSLAGRVKFIGEGKDAVTGQLLFGDGQLRFNVVLDEAVYDSAVKKALSSFEQRAIGREITDDVLLIRTRQEINGRYIEYTIKDGQVVSRELSNPDAESIFMDNKGKKVTVITNQEAGFDVSTDFKNALNRFSSALSNEGKTLEQVLRDIQAKHTINGQLVV